MHQETNSHDSRCKKTSRTMGKNKRTVLDFMRLLVGLLKCKHYEIKSPELIKGMKNGKM